MHRSLPQVLFVTTSPLSSMMDSQAETTSSTTSADHSQQLAGVQNAMDRLLGMVGGLHTDIQKISQRVDVLESPAQSASNAPAQGATTNPAPSATTTTAPSAPTTPTPSVASLSSARSANYASDSEDEAEMDKSSATPGYKVSKDTAEFVNSAFSSMAPNPVRRQWRERFGIPQLDALMTPKMDPLVKSRIHPATKSRDTHLSKQQALFLDASGPLVHLQTPRCRDASKPSGSWAMLPCI